MKLQYLLFIAALMAVASCDESPPTIPAPPTKKRVIMKESPIEQRMGIDLFDKQHFRQKSATVYYLVAEDGTVVEVGLSDFARTKIGDEFTSYEWAEKSKPSL